MIICARRFFLRASIAAIGASSALPHAALAHDPPPVPAYRTVLDATTRMVYDEEVRRLAAARGLDVVNVTWEDTGRYKGSSVGPNISDMSIQIQEKDEHGQARLHLMPVIRFPNFGDTTGDVPLDKFSLLVGNEDGKPLRRVTLKDFLGDIRAYLHEPGSWKGERTSLLAKRDTHALVSAQAAFLPIPKSGEATFNPVLFNYQSYEGDPAVLTILVTREGTSVTVIDNKRDGFEAGGVWGQRLFFNQDGQRASLTGKRQSEVALPASIEAPGVGPRVGGEEGMNMVLLIQVPLKQKNPMRFDMLAMTESAAFDDGDRARGGSDVDNAVIGHGALEGPFTEIDGLEIERDERFPVRVTVQFYKATSNGVVSATDLDQIKAQIDRVYKDADYVGSLVTSGETGRPTEYDGDKHEPPGWWDVFWQRHTKNLGMSEEQIRWVLQNVYWPGWVARPGGWNERSPWME